MSYKDFIDDNGIILTDNTAREYITMLFTYYEQTSKKFAIGNDLPLNIISLYTNYLTKKDFKIVYKDYKEKYIENESIVEPGVTKEEKEGLGEVYDYIKEFNEKNEINILLESFKIHTKLYSKCPHPEYGGYLRNSNVSLYNTNYEVVSASQAIKKFNEYAKVKIELTDPKKIFEYIERCIKITVDLIRLQPFPDGNKRTFRALLNLMLKKANIYPVYIKQEERKIYKEELLKAICENDYSGIIRFYHFKIADSIIELDIFNENNEKMYIKEETKEYTPNTKKISK